MTKKEKLIIFFALTALADKLDIKDNEIITSEKQNKKINKILEVNKGIFKNKKSLKKDVIQTFNRHVNELK